MKKIIAYIVCIIMLICISPKWDTYAFEGYSGYEGGISSGEASGKTTYEYKEMCFVSGEPILMKGTLTIKKQIKQDKITSTYTYKLSNTDKSASISRTLYFTTKLTKKEDGQTVEETSYTKNPSETVKIGSTTYVLKSNDFTRTNLIDAKPAINYFAGNIYGKKVYQIGTTSTGGTVTIEATGDFYGYDQYWGTAEMEVIDYTIESIKTVNNKIEKWGGTARVTLSTSTKKQLTYINNKPNEISFSGGYLQSQYNNSVLKYTSTLPQFDAKNAATDKMVTKSDSLIIESFPVQTRLPAANLQGIRGHWAENDIKQMYALEIFSGNAINFKPDKYITRAEFVAAIVNAAKEVPVDPALVKKTTATSKSSKKQTVVSPFDDVSIDNIYFNQINSAVKRSLITGDKKTNFCPNDSITLADALSIFVRALGLESLAPSPEAVTGFKDNDLIPSYARNYVYVAEQIGLIQGDAKGYLKPNDKLTKARAATLINKLITYMRDGINKEYADRLINY